MSPAIPVPVPIDVAAALVFRDGRLLIAQRPPGTHLAGLWEFPGGKVEPGETWEGCLRRELIEELDCEVDVGPAYAEILHAYPTKTVRLRFFLAHLTAREPRPVECAAVAWVTRDDLDAGQFPPADAVLLERLQSDPTVWPP